MSTRDRVEAAVAEFRARWPDAVVESFFGTRVVVHFRVNQRTKTRLSVFAPSASGTGGWRCTATACDGHEIGPWVEYATSTGAADAGLLALADVVRARADAIEARIAKNDRGSK
jgi:hypothetical protein